MTAGAAGDDLPRIGAVVRYAYLWRDEAQVGRTVGRKDRPCAIVAIQRFPTGSRTAVMALTHSAQPDDARAVPVPTRVKRRLGLDTRPTWIVTAEVNLFLWPGFDLLDTPARTGSYGDLPGGLVERVRKALREHAGARTLRIVGRDGG